PPSRSASTSPPPASASTDADAASKPPPQPDWRPMPNAATRFAVLAAVRHAAHHVGDYWVQTDRQAAYKGADGRTGVRACLAHVATYTATNVAAVIAANRALRLGLSWQAIAAGEAVSAVTHYAADRREHGALHW